MYVQEAASIGEKLRIVFVCYKTNEKFLQDLNLLHKFKCNSTAVITLNGIESLAVLNLKMNEFKKEKMRICNRKIKVNFKYF